MILIKKSITAQDQQIMLEIYMGKDFSVTVVNNKQKILFLQDMVQTYIVDEQRQKLVVAPNSEEQMSQIKNLLAKFGLTKLTIEILDINNVHIILPIILLLHPLNLRVRLPYALTND